MSYNHRMSQQFHGNQQQRKGRKKEDENDALMRLVSPTPSPHPFFDYALCVLEVNSDTVYSPIKKSQDVSTISESRSPPPT